MRQGAFVLITLLLVSGSVAQEESAGSETASLPVLLTDPFLQLPTEGSVRVV